MAEITLKVDYAQFNFPKMLSEIFEYGMNDALKRLANDTQFFDPDTRVALKQHMGQIQKQLHIAGHLNNDPFNFSGEYTGKYPRYPEHMRDSWTGWNIVSHPGEGLFIELYNASPAATYLYNGNSPGLTGEKIKPTRCTYMRFFYRRTKRWHIAKEVRSVEQSGRQKKFKKFIHKTIQDAINDAIDKFSPPDDERLKEIEEELAQIGTQVSAIQKYRKTLGGLRASHPAYGPEQIWFSQLLGQQYSKLVPLYARRRGLLAERRTILAQQRLTAIERMQQASQVEVTEVVRERVKQEKKKLTREERHKKSAERRLKLQATRIKKMAEHYSAEREAAEEHIEPTPVPEVEPSHEEPGARRKRLSALGRSLGMRTSKRLTGGSSGSRYRDEASEVRRSRR